MRSILILCVVLILIIAVAGTVMHRTPQLEVSDELLPGGSRPERIEAPEGPYDPILMQPVDRGRFTPPTNHRVNDITGEDDAMVQSEISIMTHGDTIVVGWNDAAGFYTPGHSGSGFGYSVDRGETWTDGGGLPEGDGTAVFGDPSIAVSADGDWIFWSLDFGDPPAGLTINRGRFEGSTLVWDPAVKYNDGENMDKEYVEYDPIRGRFYCTYMTYMGGRTGRMTYSDDDGLTWSEPVTVSTASGGNAYYPAPGIDGEVYVTWIDPMGQDNASVYARYSSDGGETWAGPAVEVAELGPSSGDAPRCFNRYMNPNVPSPAIDRSDGPYRGRIYLAWCDGESRSYDCYLSYSDDKGETWERPIKLNDNENMSEQFWPQVSVGPRGRVSAAWIDGRYAYQNNGLCDCYVTQSVDGGETWGPNRRVSDVSVSWCGVPANMTPNFGDYNELACDDRSVFAVWADARAGGPDVYVARFDDRHELAVTGELSGGRTTVNGDGVSWFIPNEAEVVVDPEPVFDSPAQLAVSSVAMGALAAPPEQDGLFQLAGENLSGLVTLTAPEGTVQGGFTLLRTGPSTIDLDFEATSSAGHGGLAFEPEWTTEATLYDAGPGGVTITGTVTMTEPGGSIDFVLTGMLTFEGAPDGRLPDPQILQQSARREEGGGSLVIHTRTHMESGAILSEVPHLVLGDNPVPQAVVRARPNPLQADTRVHYRLSRPLTGSIAIYSTDGRLVRMLHEGRLEAGEHEIAFDGRDGAGRRLAAGGYFVRLSTDQVTASGKLLVLP